MYSHPEFIMLQATERRRDLIADADQYRLLAAARRARKARRARARLAHQATRAPAPLPLRSADIPQQS